MGPRLNPAGKALLGFALARQALAKATTSPSDLRQSYDFVLVGGGNSGLTIASRLAEDETSSVLVIEAGPIYPYEKEVMAPYFSAAGYMRPKYEWDISTVPQPNLNNQELLCNQAKVLGGASTKNALVFDRALPGDLDASRPLGIEGWGWDSLLPYFNKFETFNKPPQDKVEKFGVTFDDKCHGYSGPVQVGWNDYIFPHDDAFLHALDAIGVPRAHDPACNKMGSFLMPSSLDQANQSRSDSRTAYFDPNINRTNLDVLYMNQATKILTQQVGGEIRATGIEFSAGRNATRYTIQADKEVILTAGALRTPHLLMVSGIGEAKKLARHGITPVVDVPGVGYNLQDQFTVPIFYDALAPTETSDDENDAAFMELQEHLYYHNRTGRWTRGYASVFAFLPMSNITDLTGEPGFLAQHDGAADAAATPGDAPPTVAAGYLRQRAVLGASLRAGSMAAWEVTLVGGGQITTATLLHPLSRGNVSLASADPFDNPVVDPQFLQHPADARALAQGLRILRAVAAATASFRDTLRLAEVAPGPAVGGGGGGDDDDELAAWFSQPGRGVTGNHYVGSCAMLPLEDGGVVDAALRVYGLANLRVADASAITLVPSGHNQGLVYAVAEKAADIIKADYTTEK